MYMRASVVRKTKLYLSILANKAARFEDEPAQTPIEEAPAAPEPIEDDPDFPRKNSPVGKIVSVVAKRSNVIPERLVSVQRAQNVAQARQLAMFLARDMTKLSLPQIGRWFYRDHTTVLHAIRKTEARMAADSDYAARVEALRDECRLALGKDVAP